LYFRGADKDECWEDIPLDVVFEVELGSDVRFVAIMGGLGDLEGLLECRDMVEGDLEEGKEEREVLRAAEAPPLPFELHVPLLAWKLVEAAALSVLVIPAFPPLVVGRCIACACSACLVALVL
jgi:hypothetical protein